MTFKSCLKAKRIKKAKEFSKDDTLIIKQVSYAVGYRSIPTFCHYFKEMTGLTPSEYQKSYKKRVSRKIGDLDKKNRKLK